MTEGANEEDEERLVAAIRSERLAQRARVLERVDRWIRTIAIWQPPGPPQRGIDETRPSSKWFLDLNRKGSSLSPIYDWRSLTPDERDRWAKDPIDYTAYNFGIPLSPSVSEDGSDYEITNDMIDEGFHILPPDYNLRRGVQLWNRYRRDHPRACGGKFLPVPEQPFRLMDLPTELRRRVFVFLFRGQLIGKTGLVTYMGDDRSAGTYYWRADPLDVRVFAVSKAIKAEAMEVFFEENVFSIELYDNEFESQPPSLFLKTNLDSWPIGNLRKVDIRIVVRGYREKRYLSALIRRLCETLHKCQRLVEVRITTHKFDFARDSRNKQDETTDEILEVFEMLKGVGKVVFPLSCEYRSRFLERKFVIAGSDEMRQRVGRIMTSQP